MQAIVKSIVAIVVVLALLAFEAFAAMLTYTVLALYSLDVFGYLVGLSDTVLKHMVSWLQYLMPSTKNLQYSTLVGELSPKSMLLLLIGLVVGAIIRFVFWGIAKMLGARTRYGH